MKILTLIASTLLCASLVQAAPGPNPDAGMMGGGMMGMMNHEQMMAMHEHMRQMQTLMGEIQQEKNADKRQAMLMKHRDMMRDGMHMLQGGKAGMGKGMPMDKGMKMEMQPEQCMQMMEERMKMMQMMMGQMMDHEKVMNQDKHPMQK